MSDYAVCWNGHRWGPEEGEPEKCPICSASAAAIVIDCDAWLEELKSAYSPRDPA